MEKWRLEYQGVGISEWFYKEKPDWLEESLCPNTKIVTKPAEETVVVSRLALERVFRDYISLKMVRTNHPYAKEIAKVLGMIK